MAIRAEARDRRQRRGKGHRQHKCMEYRGADHCCTPDVEPLLSECLYSVAFLGHTAAPPTSVMNCAVLLPPEAWTSHQLYNTPEGSMSALGQKRITANRMSALGQKQTCAAHMPFYFAPAATHSFTKRERSSIFTFCCSASFAHSRIFFALSLGIIFSGAVAFTSADATCARNIATKVTAVKNTVGRCLRMNALLWLVHDEVYRARARKLRAMGASHPNADTRQRYYNGAKGHKRTRAVH